ncbi:Saccharopine dehydrogenase [Spraguea lophii 42_110]|uniref:Saccharopine dehydrogenase n=1 Tax=Spraguea lophii (strain 42_110) TaxID=1358809 RepID=S7XJA5_SPRLO|nr:Saccharopine dehydrogenase [Spraguea lophii 42_110]
MDLSQRKYDVIIYGGSSITAKYTLKEFMVYNLKMAVAGRNYDRIDKNVDYVVDILECSIENIEKISKLTKILVNCAGPFIFCGEEVVKGCINTGTHYIDVTGENIFIEKILHKYNEEAKKKGVLILNACGFDSIPADIGSEYLKRNMEGINKSITSVLQFEKCQINKTSYISLVHSLSAIGELRKIRGNKKKISKEGKQPIKKLTYSKETKSWWTIFMGTDIAIVKRTQKYFKEHGEEPMKYACYIDTGNLFNTILFWIGFFIIFAMAKFSFTKKLLLKFPTFFTNGIVPKTKPTEEEIEKGKFKMLFFGESYVDGVLTKKKLTIEGGDPGYVATPYSAVSTAQVLLEMINQNKVTGGIHTPGSVLDIYKMVNLLEDKGITFKIE